MPKILIDVPDELFARVEDKWKTFVESKEITLPKRKLMLWAIEQFALWNAEIRDKPTIKDE